MSTASPTSRPRPRSSWGSYPGTTESRPPVLLRGSTRIRRRRALDEEGARAMPDHDRVNALLLQHYGEAARRAAELESTRECCDAVGAPVYDRRFLDELPAEAAAASIGCANPVAIADLDPGEDVLDLGSGGGIDVLLSARRVAPGGTAYGLDMTDEMLVLAEKNRREAGVENAEFLKGHIEDVPLPDSSVDVVISNCVINLSDDKPAVIQETFRVLRPGGRFVVSDVVFLGDKGALPEDLLETVGLWTGCVAGALAQDEYEALLADAGFEETSVEVTSTYDPEYIDGLDTEEGREALRRVPAASTFVRATKLKGE